LTFRGFASADAASRGLYRLESASVAKKSPPSLWRRQTLYGVFAVKRIFLAFFVGFFVRVRRETGKKSVVKVHHGEGVAIHIDPESCADAREGIGEALTGERIGQAIEP
jgi:hypothetical protein